MLGILSLCAMFVMLLLLPACSGQTTQAPVSGTPAGNYTITVTATSGSDTKSQTITLSVP
jgi:ABC-type glycerol-3-phosphate transport system substrate-binding protein